MEEQYENSSQHSELEVLKYKRNKTIFPKKIFGIFCRLY
jgi:hypothetical protein